MEKFEWDPRKEIKNVGKHGIDFTTASTIWTGPVYERLDDRHDYGEDRYQAFGIVADRVLTVVFTWRGGTRRLISARRADRGEKELYEAEINRNRPAQN